MDYLDKALELLQKRAYFAHRVDWAALRAQAREHAAHARTPADCSAAISLAVAALADGHSFFIPAAAKGEQGPTGTPLGFGVLIVAPEMVVSEVFPDTAADRAGLRPRDVITAVNGEPPTHAGGRRLALDPSAPVRLTARRGASTFAVELIPAPIEKAPMPHGRLLTEGIGYLELFVQGRPDEQQAYIDAAQAVIRQGIADGARAWVVDLRRDRGGNMWSMITGAGALMGDGQLGMFIDADGSETRWFYHGGVSSYQQTGEAAPTEFTRATDPAPTLDPQTVPVAVLHSEFTGSAGEMTLISFLGRPNTRAFGAPTTGEITGVAMHELEDGALLGIAESISADRLGRRYETAITADEPLVIDWYRCGADDDPVIAAAVDWLRGTFSHILT